MPLMVYIFKLLLEGDKKTLYYNRKGVTSFDVMTVCDFDLFFTYVMARWEGVAHDICIFLDSIHRQFVNFPKPPLGIYYFYILNMYEGCSLCTSHIYFFC